MSPVATARARLCKQLSSVPASQLGLARPVFEPQTSRQWMPSGHPRWPGGPRAAVGTQVSQHRGDFDVTAVRPGVQPDSRLSRQAYQEAVTSALKELRPSTDRIRHGRLDPAVLLQDASRLGQLA